MKYLLILDNYVCMYVVCICGQRIELALRSALTEEQSVALEGDDAPDQKDARNRSKEAVDAHMRMMRWYY